MSIFLMIFLIYYLIATIIEMFLTSEQKLKFLRYQQISSFIIIFMFPVWFTPNILINMRFEITFVIIILFFVINKVVNKIFEKIENKNNKN